ncbi:MAG: glycosyltransferase [archaeon]
MKSKPRDTEMRKDVAIIGPVPPFRGGISQYNDLLISQLSKSTTVRSYSFSRLYPKSLYPGRSQKDMKSKPVSKVKPEYIIDSINPFTWIRAAVRIAKGKPDMIIAHWWTPFFAPCLFVILTLTRCMTKTKVMYITHHVLPLERRWADHLLTKIAFLPATHVLLHVGKDRTALSKVLGKRQAAKKKVLQSPIPPLTTAPFYKGSGKEARARLGIKSEHVLLMFGLVRKNKGLPSLLEAIPTMAKSVDLTLLVVGEFFGEDKTTIEQTVKDKKIDKHVRIIDQYIPDDEIGAYFAAADAVILPYTKVTQSGVVQLAYHFGTPVLVSDLPGLREAVEEGKTGSLFSPGDPSDIARTAVSFLSGSKGASMRKNIATMDKDRSWKEFCDKIRESF